MFYLAKGVNLIYGEFALILWSPKLIVLENPTNLWFSKFFYDYFLLSNKLVSFKLFIFYLLFPDGDTIYFNWLIGVEFNGGLLEMTLVLIGVEAFEMFIKGVDNILLFKLNGPCIIIETS